MGKESLKAPEDHEVICETLSLRNGCKNKAKTITILLDMLARIEKV